MSLQCPCVLLRFYFLGTSSNEGGDCWHGGKKGVCLDTSKCTGTRVAGLCPGPSNIQCCLNNKCTVRTTNDGICVQTSTCRGTTTAGKCYGASDIRCCTSSKRQSNDSLLLEDESPLCPEGAEWDDGLKFCASDTVVYGPFPNDMVDECVNVLNGGDVCTAKVYAD